MEFYHYFPSVKFVKFVVLTTDQFVGRDGGPLEQQKQDSHGTFVEKSHISSDFKEKSESSLQRRRSLRENKEQNS